MVLWAKAMQALFRYAIHLRNQRDKLSIQTNNIKLKSCASDGCVTVC